MKSGLQVQSAFCKRGEKNVRDCISVETMRESDRLTIERKVSGRELMGRAAQGVFRAVEWKGSAAIVAGSGNNGGDGYALACILQKHGIPCAVFTLSDRLSEDGGYYARKAAQMGVPIRPFAAGEGLLQTWDIVVDCLLGTGFHGEVRESYRAAIGEINQSGAYVVSVDINSGMNGDTGACGDVVRSDLTVTIGFVKRGLVMPQAGQYMKRLVCTDIGIDLCREERKLCTADEWQALSEGQRVSGRFALCPLWLEAEVIVSLEHEI